MIVLDAGVLIAHLAASDRHHARATALLLDAPPASLLVHGMTLADVLVGGVRVGRGTQLHADLERAGIAVARSDAEEPLRLAGLRVATRLQLPDCCALDLALSRHAGLATFDAALAAVARERGVVVLPEPPR